MLELFGLGARAVYTGLQAHLISTQPPVVNALENQSTATSEMKGNKFKEGQKIIKLSMRLTSSGAEVLGGKSETLQHLFPHLPFGEEGSPGLSGETLHVILSHSGEKIPWGEGCGFLTHKCS